MLAIVLFHAGLPGFSGGFVGVDIFFVISGFLIGNIIISETAAGTFSFADFFARRVRRIFPALFVTMAVTFVAAAAILLPEHFRDFGQSVLATAVFLSNMLFWKEAGYFDTSADFKPLLHTWSLGVEEQFYLILPLLIVAAHRFSRRHLPHILIALLLASLVYSAVLTPDSPVTAFYLLPTRLWEFLFGVVLATRALPRVHNSSLRAAMALLGLTAIGWSIVTYSSATLFPGLAALLPVFGAALIIHSGQGGTTSVSYALSGRVPVFFGKISYSLYLWHWPLFVFYRYATIREITPLETALLLGASVVFAYLSWKYVEAPFRKRGPLVQIRKVYLSAGIAMSVACILGFAVHFSGGWAQRFEQTTLDIAKGSDLLHDRRDCHFASQMASVNDLCVQGAEGAEPSFLLLGDSHADMLGPGLFAAAGNLGLAGLQLTDSSYFPAPGWFLAGYRQRDAANHRLLSETFRSHPGIELVLITQFWNQVIRRNLFQANGDRSLAKDSFVKGLSDLITAHPDKTFLILQDTPYSVLFGPGAKARRQYLNPTPGAMHEAEFDQQIGEYAEILTGLALLPNVEVIETRAPFCLDGQCPAELNGKLLHRDTDHLSTFGAELLTPLLKDLLEGFFGQSAATDRPN